MDWKRVKSILIALLLVTNLILGYSVYAQFQSRAASERQAYVQAVGLFGGALGITVDMISALPYSMQSWDIKRDTSAEEAFAKAVLGESDFTAEDGGGGIMKYFAGAGYGEVKNRGEMDFTLYTDAVPEDSAAYFRDLLSGAGITLDGVDAEATPMGGVSFAQSWQGMPLSGNNLVCSVQGGRAHMIGNWIMPASANESKSAPARGELVLKLCVLLQNQGIAQVSGISGGYYVQNTQAGDRVVPVWLVETPAGQLVFDLLGGRLLS